MKPVSFYTDGGLTLYNQNLDALATLTIIGMSLSSLIEATLAQNGVGKSTGNTGPYTRRYSGLHVPDPRESYVFKER